MKTKCMFATLLLLLSLSAGAVKMQPPWTPSKTPEAAADDDVKSDAYHIYTVGLYVPPGTKACAPVGVEDVADLELIKNLSWRHVYCDDVSTPFGLSPKWQAEYNEQVLRRLRDGK
jgi:hypothetical protein